MRKNLGVNMCARESECVCEREYKKEIERVS